MNKIMTLFFMLLIAFTTNVKAECSGNLQKYFDIRDEEIKLNSTMYTCYDLHYLKINNIKNLSYSDYQKMYPNQQPSGFSENDLNPTQAEIIAQKLDQKKESYTASNVRREIEMIILNDKAIQDIYSLPSGQFEKKITTGKCSPHTFPEFEELSLAYKPYTSVKGYFLSAFGNSYAFITPTKNSGSQSVLKLGQYEKIIPWKKVCYTGNDIIDAFKTGCVFCPFYEKMFDTISSYSYILFNKLKETVFYLALILMSLFMARDGLFGILSPTFGEKLFGPALDFKLLIKKYFKQFILIGLFGAVFLPEYGTRVIPEILDLITTPLFILTNHVNEIFAPAMKCDYGQALTYSGMLGSSFKSGYMCLAQNSFMILLQPVLIGLQLIFSLSITKIICGIILVYIFLKNLFNVALYLMTPLIQIGIRLLLLPITLFFIILGFKDFKMFKLSDLWEALIQMCFISIFTTFFTMFTTILIEAVAEPEKISDLENLTYTGATFWELVIIGFIAGYVLKKIPEFSNMFSGYFGGRSGIDEKIGDSINAQISSGIKEYNSTKDKFEKEKMFWSEDKKTQRGISALGRDVKKWYNKNIKRIP